MVTKKLKENQQKHESLADIIAKAESATSQEEMIAVKVKLNTLLMEGFRPAKKGKHPYEAAIEMTDEFRKKYIPTISQQSLEGLGIGSGALELANALSRSKRRIAYALKTGINFDGLRLVEEGDSWTQYPILLDDIVDQLSENSDIAIYSVGSAGDLVSNMAKQKEYLKALKETGAKGMILSGGGNDLFDEFGAKLQPYVKGEKPALLIKEETFQPMLETIKNNFQTILTDVAENYPEVTVFGHGYDLPYPNEGGSWLGPAFVAKGIPLDVGRDILRIIIDRFNEMLKALAQSNEHFILSDLRGKIDKGPDSWFDEVHPKNSGFGRAAAIMEKAIRQQLSS